MDSNKGERGNKFNEKFETNDENSQFLIELTSLFKKKIEEQELKLENGHLSFRLEGDDIRT